MAKIYTRTGDAGDTSIVGGHRVSKASQRIESYGMVDELNANVGMLRALCSHEHDLHFLSFVQSALFVVGGNLATDQSLMPIRPGNVVEDDMIATLEAEIDAIVSVIPPAQMFVVPGGCQAAAAAHICRTVCRRTEREVFRLAQHGHVVDANVLAFINRLSDYFFVLARKLNSDNNIKETIWKRIH